MPLSSGDCYSFGKLPGGATSLPLYSTTLPDTELSPLEITTASERNVCRGMRDIQSSDIGSGSMAMVRSGDVAWDQVL